MRSSEELSNLMMTDSSIDRYEIPNLNQNEKKSSPPINVVN